MKTSKIVDWILEYHVVFFLIFFGILSALIWSSDSRSLHESDGVNIENQFSQNNNRDSSELDFMVSPPNHINLEPIHHCTCQDQFVIVEKKYKNKCKCQDIEKEHHCICDICNCHHCLQ